MKKVAIYIRVSTQEQANEGYSIQAQKERLINYAKAKNWNIYDIFIDGGFSGSNIDRPAIKKMLSDLDNIDVVLVYKLDRLSRSQKDTLYLIEEKFLKHNVDFVSLQESFDTTTPFGRAMIGILSVFAQLERETIIERSKMGQENRAKDGLWHGAIPPHGYKYLPQENQLIIDHYEAEHVKKIFELYNKNYGYQKIAYTLNNQGLKKRNGVDWQINAVKRILNNSAYKGYIKYNDELFLGNHEPIISSELFDKTQELLKKRSTPRYTKSKYLLNGLIYCGYCGARARGTWITRSKGGKKSYYYYCYSAAGWPKHMVKDSECPGKHMKMKKVEDYVVNKIMSINLNKDKLIERHNKENKDSNNNMNIIALKDRIKELEKQIDKLMNLYQYGNIPASELSSRIEKLYADKKQLEKTILDNKKNVNKNKLDINIDELLYYANNFKLIWNEATLEEKKILIQFFVEKVIVYNDDIEVELKV